MACTLDLTANGRKADSDCSGVKEKIRGDGRVSSEPKKNTVANRIRSFWKSMNLDFTPFISLCEKMALSLINGF